MDLNRRLQRRVRIRKTNPYLLLQRAQNWSVNCYLDEAVVFMRSECNGRTDCYIHPDVFTVEKDPCPGTERYLEAHYRCTPNQGNCHNPNPSPSPSPKSKVKNLNFHSRLK